MPEETPNAMNARLHYEFLRAEYMKRNPPPKPVCATPTIHTDGTGNFFMQYGDIVNGLVGYRNSNGGFGDNLFTPAKQSFTGWISPGGFLFSTPDGKIIEHAKLAATICERLGLQGDPEICLDNAGWLRLSRDRITGSSEPNEVQAGALLALMGE